MKGQRSGLSRRELAIAAVAAAPVAAQTQPPADEALEAARAQTKEAIAKLRKTRVPMLLEPSFIFRP